MRTWFQLAVSLVALIALTACGSDGSDAGESATAQPSAPASGQQPDTSDIPEVVAEVNGEELKKDEFVVAYTGQYQQAASQGQPVNEDELRTQVVENMVSTTLLTQAADQRGLTASEDEVEKALKAAAEQSGMELAEFLAALAQQGLTKEQVLSDLERQVKIDKLLEDEAGPFRASKAELKKLYEQLVDQQEQSGQSPGTEPPSYEEVKPQLEQQVVQQKKNEAGQALIKQLRQDADVTINL